MAQTFVEWTSDGSRTLYPVQFSLGYLREECVYVYQGEHRNYNTQLQYTWVNGTQIELTNPVPEGGKFYIRRIVNRNQLLNDYQDGALLVEENLDDSYAQTLAIVEEINDGFWSTDTTSGTFNTDLDMAGNKILNLEMDAAPDDKQAANVAYVKKMSGALAEYWAEVAKTQAEAAEADATVVQALSAQWREDYLGNFDRLPDVVSHPQGIAEGALCYYDGVQYTQGLYIYYDHHSNQLTGPWELVSGPGPQGPTGAEGAQGPIGEKGDQGIQGVDGPQGQQGIQGPIGDTGPAGPKGETGSQGVDGPQGIQGAVGPIGPEGPTGVQGIQGPQGIQGAVGPKGDMGEDGQSFKVDATGTLAERVAYDNETTEFAYYATDYEVAADAPPDFDRHTGDGTTTQYVLSWTPDGQQSILIEVGGVVQGPDMYTLAVATDTYTLNFNTAPDLNASIIIRGVTINTGYGAIFIKESDASADWSVPIPFGKGPRGDQGPQGDVGPTGNQGPTGDQGDRGPAGPTGVQGPQGIVGPQGPNGDVGPQGAKGDAGDRGPTGIQGPQGDRGATGVQGPQGNTGATGSQGPQGPKGDKGERGDQGPTGPTGARGDKGPTGNKGVGGQNGTDGTNGSDGADGRSMSGRVFTCGTRTASPGNSILVDTARIGDSQNFNRILFVGGEGIPIASNHRTENATMRSRLVNTWTGQTVTSGYVEAGPKAARGGERGLPPLGISVPANTQGNIQIWLDVQAGSEYIGEIVRSAQYLVQLVPDTGGVVEL